MSIITCQIGQCGNQLGEAVFSKLVEEAKGATSIHQLSMLDTFFQPSKKAKSGLFANALLIDMEPKVIDKVIDHNFKRGWDYNPKMKICKQEGSGNNWAFGFNFHGKETSDEIMDKLRKTIECIDVLDGLYIIQSLAGGTGSGVGSRVLTEIRDEMPDINLFSTAILPRLSGEVILQFYNCVFSLSTLYNVIHPFFIKIFRSVMGFSFTRMITLISFARKYIL